MMTNDGEVYHTRAVPGECVYNRHDAIAEVLYSKRVLNAVTNKIFDMDLLMAFVFLQVMEKCLKTRSYYL